MKLVTFSRAMAPHGVGDQRLVSDDVAESLRRTGAISASEAWPSAEPAVRPPVKPQRPIVRPERPTSQLDLRVAE